VHLLEGWRFQCIHVWGLGFRCICLRSDDFGAFMCEGDSSAFTWGMMIMVFSCVEGRMSVHLTEEWWFRCIHVWGVRFWCIYLRDDDFGAFMCKWQVFGAFTWGVTISVHSFVRSKIPVHLPEEWRFRCIHVWGVRFRCIYLREDNSLHLCMRGRVSIKFLRSDDFGAFMCEG